MRKDTPLERLYNGIIKENPTFVMMLGMCPTLAVTTSAKNGIGRVSHQSENINDLSAWALRRWSS